MRAFLPGLLLLATPLAAPAATYLVNPDFSGDFPRIQDAVNAATDGDVILLGAGTFSGIGNRNITFGGKEVTIRSASGSPISAVLDCQGDATNAMVAFWFQGEGPGTVVEALTVRNSRAPAGALRIESGSAPVIRDVIIESSPLSVRSLASSPTLEEVVVRDGGQPACLINGGEPLLTGCVFEANTVFSSAGAGAIQLWSATAVFEDCRISANGGWGAHGAVDAKYGVSLTLRNCLITGNDSYFPTIVVASGASATIERCTLASNGGPALRVGCGGNAEMVRSIVWGNCAPVRIESGSTLTVDCSNLLVSEIEGGGTVLAGADILEVAPEFCAPLACEDSPGTGGIYTLPPGAPALTQPCGPMGVDIGVCAVAVESRSWGEIKALYR